MLNKNLLLLCFFLNSQIKTSIRDDIKKKIIFFQNLKLFSEVYQDKSKVYQDKKDLIEPEEEEITINIFEKNFQIKSSKLQIFDFNSLLEKELPDVHSSPVGNLSRVVIVKNFENLPDETKNLHNIFKEFYKNYELSDFLKTEFCFIKEFLNNDLLLKEIKFSFNNNLYKSLYEEEKSDFMEELEFKENMSTLEGLLTNKIIDFFNQL